MGRKSGKVYKEKRDSIRDINPYILMKIVFIGGRDIPKHGGIETYVYNLALQLVSEGHKVWIICQSKEGSDDFVDGLRLTKIASSNGLIGICRFLRKATNMVAECEEQYDVVNYHRFYFTKWLIKPLNKRGIKTCFTNHSFAADNPKHNFLTKKALWMIKYFAFYGIDNCITVSEIGAKLLKQRYGKSSQIIRGGIFIPSEKKVECQILSKFGLKKGKYYLTICRIDPVKDLESLISGFIKRTANNDIKLVIAGDENNDYGRALLELAKDDEKVVFTGSVYGEDKIALLQNAMAYCLVSKSEGFPIALLEAMSYGNVCIVSDIEANREAIPYNLGLWTTVSDSNSVCLQMNQLEKGVYDVEMLRVKIKQHVCNNFTWKITAEKYVAYLKTIVKG